MVEVINGITLVEGILDTPNPKQCLIEIFANRTADPSGFGEGEQWVAALYPNSDGTFQIAIPQDLLRQVPGSYGDSNDGHNQQQRVFAARFWRGLLHPTTSLRSSVLRR